MSERLKCVSPATSLIRNEEDTSATYIERYLDVQICPIRKLQDVNTSAHGALCRSPKKSILPDTHGPTRGRSRLLARFAGSFSVASLLNDRPYLIREILTIIGIPFFAISERMSLRQMFSRI